MTKTNKIFFSSDFHYGHTNICAGTSKWGDKANRCRAFNTIEEMNTKIVKSINSVVGKDDILYHLGDWSFGGWENIWNFRKQIICEHIIQINGNHDEHIYKDKFFPFLEKQDTIIYEIADKKDYHIWRGAKTLGDVTAKDFFEQVHNGRFMINIDGQRIIVDHYPYEEWEDMDHGTWMLHGHTHHDLDRGETSMRYKRLDVGWNGKVYSFDEIKEVMNKRENKKHH